MLITLQFINTIGTNIRFVAKYGEPLDSHGVWQKIFVEAGILGLIFFIIFIVNIALTFNYNFKKTISTYVQWRH